VIVDSSAIVAILLREPGWERLVDLVATVDGPHGVGAPTLVETGIVLVARVGVPGKSLLARFVEEASMRVIDLTADHWTVAVGAYLRFGKGRHPAALNFGDCLTYAVAKLAAVPLLCLGNDFAQTDLELVTI